MTSTRSLSSIAVCLCIQLSVCPLGSASASHSLWGKKLVFTARPCMWQLQPDVAVPDLQELSVCLLLQRHFTSDWTGFAYKAPGGGHIELGLGGKQSQLVAWLFGEQWQLDKDLTLYEWHSVCLTWSGPGQRLRLYLNGTNHLEASLNSSQTRHLAPNGTLTLGVSHNVDPSGELKPESQTNLLGEIGLFRMWAGERSGGELGRQGCADGDVVSWDLRQWRHTCPPVPDESLRCAGRAVCIVPLLLYTHSKLSFSSEVFVSVDPAANVGSVQSDIADSLILTFHTNYLNLTADPESLRVLPVETLSAATASPPAVPTITFSVNVGEIVDVIEELVDVQLGSTAKLSASDLSTVMEKLDAVVDTGAITPKQCGSIVNIVADVLLSETDVTLMANNVLNLTERMGDNMDFQGDSISLLAPSLAMSMINVDPVEFRGLTFGVSFLSPNQDPKDPQTTNATQSIAVLNSYVVSASINNSHVSNLRENHVVVTFSNKNATKENDKIQCVFWDFQKNQGLGGWSGSGCETLRITDYQTACLCDHLTHFGVLLDVTRDPIPEAHSQILTVVSYLGCGISSIFLGLTLITYLAFEKLRRDYPSKILINLSLALLGLNMLYLLDSWLSSFSNYGLCIATAATMHYFLLASFTWMGLEAVHMYFALVKVFNTYVPSYILKFCIAGWGIPLVIVGLVLAIDKDAYGGIVTEDAAVMLQSTDAFCWLQDDVFYYATVVAFILLILLCNISVFVVVLIQIRQMTTNKSSGDRSLHELRAVASLTVLLGLTWSLGFFALGPARVALFYLFAILNCLQGFFLFLFHCLMKENVRKQWRIHLCCGRFRLSDHSDWSRSAVPGGQCKQGQLVNSDSVASNNTSSIRKISDSSTGMGPNHQQGE
ncbi:adhesion G protein-coupled receptor G4a [Genypterus blacodes]|uniref:adhesion G protein-coupled receptor G4a n=1 Tax=Genypterus blacodes TaxID=154954 RepID=UPI003F772187